MTAAQRRAINRHNARKSTGPITPEGKEHTRLNAIKHGLCATILAFSNEDADTVQAQLDEWVEHYQPVGPAEFALVEEIAVSHLRLRRCRSREASVVEFQVVETYKVWCDVQAARLSAAVDLLATHPAAAVHDLKQFGEGRLWLIQRSLEFGKGMLGNHYQHPTPAQLHEGLQLLGGDPARLAAGPVAAFKFALGCAGAGPNADPKAVARLLSDAAIHPDYLAEFGREVPTSEECRNLIGMTLGEDLSAQTRALNDGENDNRNEVAAACLRAQLPYAGNDNKLSLRYESMARAALHKGLKALDQMQDARYAVEAEMAAEADVIAIADAPREPVFPAARNEPEPPPEPQSSPECGKGCDPSTETNPDAPKGEPIVVAADAGIIAIEAPASVAPTTPVVTPKAADSPPA